MEEEIIKSLRSFKREKKSKEKNVSGGTLSGQNKSMSVNKNFQKRKKSKIKISFKE